MQKILFISLLLSACTINPNIERNWHKGVIESHNSLWQKRYIQAERSISIEAHELKTGQHPALIAWRKKLSMLAGKTKLEQLDGINSYINKTVLYIRDYDHYEKNDQWGFPLETLEEGGDCEDFAFLKAISLEYLGWSKMDMAILVGEYHGQTIEGHAVLMVTLENGGEVILDNMYLNLMTPNKDWLFQPLYVIKHDHFYLVANDFIKDKRLFSFEI